MSLRCPRCGATYSGTARFCTRDGAPLAVDLNDSHAHLTGRILDGRYKIEKKIGEGGMSFVYLARDTETGQRDAIKVLSPGLSRDKTAMERLRREAEFGIRLAHPNVCNIKRLGETATGLVYVVMPYLEGEILADRTHRLRQLRLDDVIGFVREIAAGLHAAHELAIVHRDLKPENIMITRGVDGRDHAVVMDFGLAKERRAGAELAKLTATGIVLGTPEFMSPEQLRGKPLDGRTDVYSLSLMTVEMLTGKLPFAGSEQQEVMMARLRDEPTPIRKLRPDLGFSVAVERVLLKGLERAPADRYATAPEFAEALAAASTTATPGGTTGVLKRLFGCAVLAVALSRSSAAQQVNPPAPPPPPPNAPPVISPSSRSKLPATKPTVQSTNPPAPPVDTTKAFSGVVGVAVDSVHGGPLIDAVVAVSGTERQATTDSLGQFRIDGVPPGAYKLALFHPVLDSLGVAISSQTVTFPAGRYAVVRIATPSAPTLAKLFCSPDKLLTGPSIVVGRVLEADTDVPDSGARVVLYWTQMEVGRSIGVRHIPKVRQATVDASGTFQICGVPDNIQGTLRASRGSIATAGVPLTTEGRLLTLSTLYLASPEAITSADSGNGAAGAPGPTSAAAAHSGLRRGKAVATGRVTDQGGRAIAGADVGVLGAAATTATDDSGRFTLRGLPSGTQSLTVRKLTYTPAEVAVSLTVRQPRSVTVLMHPSPPQLATVNVQAPKMEQGLKRVGFSDRKRTGLGHYLTEDQIASKLPQVMTDVFTTIPGISVSYASGQPVLQSTRNAGGGCISYFIDGAPYSEQTPGDINDYMKPDELSAVEVYNSSDAPAQFTQTGHSSCSVVVMWTKTKIGG